MSDTLVFDRCDLVSCLDGELDVSIETFRRALAPYRERGIRMMLAIGADRPGDPSGALSTRHLNDLQRDLDRLEDAGLQFDGISLGGPTRRTDDLVIDDRLVSFAEFVTHSPDEIAALLDAEAKR